MTVSIITSRKIVRAIFEIFKARVKWVISDDFALSPNKAVRGIILPFYDVGEIPLPFFHAIHN